MALAKDIATDFRVQVDDTDTEDPLWTDAEIVRYMNLAINDFAKKTLCLSDASNTTFTELTVTQDSEWVPYNGLILEFDPQTAYSAAQNKNIPMLDKGTFEGQFRHDNDYGKRTPAPAWQTTTGQLRALISDIQFERFRAYPIPNLTETLVVRVKRLPENAITDISDVSVEVPEIPAKFHEDLIINMQYRAYLKHDAETYDKGLSDLYLRQWDLEAIPEAKRLIKRADMPKSAVAKWRPNG